MSISLNIINLFIRKGSPVHWAPVDQVFPPIDESIVVEAHKDFLNRFYVLIVHGKTLAIPVARVAHSALLLQNDITIFLHPFPDPLRKCLPAQIVSVFAFIFLERPLNNILCCNTRMVFSRHP